MRSMKIILLFILLVTSACVSKVADLSANHKNFIGTWMMDYEEFKGSDLYKKLSLDKGKPAQRQLAFLLQMRLKVTPTSYVIISGNSIDIVEYKVEEDAGNFLALSTDKNGTEKNMIIKFDSVMKIDFKAKANSVILPLVKLGVESN